MKSECITCGVEFSYLPSQKLGKYCSNRCQGDLRLMNRFKRVVDGITRWVDMLKGYVEQNVKYVV